MHYPNRIHVCIGGPAHGYLVTTEMHKLNEFLFENGEIRPLTSKDRPMSCEVYYKQNLDFGGGFGEPETVPMFIHKSIRNQADVIQCLLEHAIQNCEHQRCIEQTNVDEAA